MFRGVADVFGRKGRGVLCFEDGPNTRRHHCLKKKSRAPHPIWRGACLFRLRRPLRTCGVCPISASTFLIVSYTKIFLCTGELPLGSLWKCLSNFSIRIVPFSYFKRRFKCLFFKKKDEKSDILCG